MENTIIGTIKLNNNTKNHEKSLKALGYETTSDGEKLIVTGSEVVTHLDLSGEDPAGVLLEVIEGRKLLTYGTRVTFATAEGPKEVSSVPMCLKLGALCKQKGIPHNLSCLVIQPEGKGKKATSTVQVDERFRRFG